jgi:hypothetical protein
VFGAAGVVYGPQWLGMALHVLPLLLCTLDVVVGGKARRMSYLRGARTAATSWGAGAALPALLGASRAVLFGRPLVWFGKPLVTLALFLPPAMVAVAMPYGRAAAAAGTSAVASAAARADGGRGAALVTALAAAVFGCLGCAIGYLPALWSVGVLTALHLPLPDNTGLLAPLACLAATAPAAALSAPVVYVTFTLLSEKVGISGSEPWPLGLPIGDALMGALTGLLTALATAGIVPFVFSAGAGASGASATQHKTSQRFFRRAVLLAAATWVAAALVSALMYPTPYSTHAPKRLAVLHQHDANVVVDAPTTTAFLVGAFDSVPAATALPLLHRAAVLRPTTREDFGSFHPVTNLLGEGLVLPARPAARPPWGVTPPAVTMAVMTQPPREEQQQWEGVVRIGVTYDIRAPAWSCARVTSRAGPVLAWSLSSVLPDGGGTIGAGAATGAGGAGDGAGAGAGAGGKARGKAAGSQLWARHAGNGEQSRVWTFWVEVAAGHEGGVEVDAWSLFPGVSDELEAVVGSLGDHISSIVGTQYRVKTVTL